MDENKIIELYKQGLSITFITNAYYNSKNINTSKMQLVGNTWVIPKIYFTRKKCAEIVNKTIYEYLKKGG